MGTSESECQHLISPLTRVQISGDQALSTVNVIQECLQWLGRREQSTGQRRALLAKYGAATRDLRVTMSSSPYSPTLGIAAFLFTLYEMIVNIDSEDHTWQIHLGGLLNILSQLPSYQGDDQVQSVQLAIEIANSEGDPFQALASHDMGDIAKAFVILDIAMLRLRQVAEDLENLCQEVKTPRKLDVQKLRASIKHIQRNLNLFPKICQSLNFDIAEMHIDDILGNHLLLARVNDYHCLQIITSDLLVETGRYVYSNGSFEKSKEYSILYGIIHQATRSIRAAVPGVLHRTAAQTQDYDNRPMKPLISGLLVVWPLCCCYKASELSLSQQDWIRDTLWSIGSDGFIPKASALAQSQGANAKWTDVLAGLLLVRVATSGELRCLVGCSGPL
ncbi:hypothetical protein L228DRAFT_279153 [Xylona heveae TC161]|uniref:Uncharacterized protein n=1 Tax=Xylona heveae (strain CBS 132557 / TC161) TaxID=1328760 RepID=A0A165J8C0_XYLHT|nr:hypothetical protein L228DRAFT_279153 [Xylona heveae TC161]KZF25885.1 hypothetical protein L228DRAFT_279153 [Xylona heveae TC161]